MKRGTDRVRAPAHSRGYRVEAGSQRNTSVGEALRKAKKDLVLRRFIYYILLFLVVVAFIAIAYGGYFGKLIQYLMDHLL